MFVSESSYTLNQHFRERQVMYSLLLQTSVNVSSALLWWLLSNAPSHGIKKRVMRGDGNHTFKTGNLSTRGEEKQGPPLPDRHSRGGTNYSHIND